ENKWFFGVGAMLASLVWFSAIGYGSRAASKWMTKPIFWKVLDFAIAAVMFSVALTLALYRF
ncbi:MAG: LysE family transporter, partial [Micrococcales bacterium]